MFNIKSLAMATAVSASAIFAMPGISQAMQPKSTVHVQPGSQSNLETKKSKDWWARHCMVSNDVKCGHSTTASRHQNYTGHTIYRRHHKAGVTIKPY